MDSRNVPSVYLKSLMSPLSVSLENPNQMVPQCPDSRGSSVSFDSQLSPAARKQLSGSAFSNGGSIVSPPSSLMVPFDSFDYDPSMSASGLLQVEPDLFGTLLDRSLVQARASRLIRGTSRFERVELRWSEDDCNRYLLVNIWSGVTKNWGNEMPKQLKTIHVVCVLILYDLIARIVQIYIDIFSLVIVLRATWTRGHRRLSRAKSANAFLGGVSR